MKKLKLISVTLFTLMSISACGNDEREITGTMHYIEQMGTKCWYITDTKTNYNFEVLRSENYNFHEGQKVRIKAAKGSGTTFCKVGEKISLLSLKLL
jgi:hypothetical protein